MILNTPAIGLMRKLRRSLQLSESERLMNTNYEDLRAIVVMQNAATLKLTQAVRYLLGRRRPELIYRLLSAAEITGIRAADLLERANGGSLPPAPAA